MADDLSQEITADRMAASADMKNGRFNRAEAALRRLVARQPGDAGVHHDLAVALAKQGKLDEAISVFDKALKLEPNAADTLRNLAIALAQRGRPDEAEANFSRAVEAEPDSAVCRRDWANSLRALGKLADAVIQYREALRLKPDWSETHHDLGLVLAELKRTNEAEECYREALRLRPDFPDALNNLGILLENQGAFDKAVEAYRAALRFKPSAADVHNNLGVALAAQRKYEDAAASYRQALTLTPDSPLALNNLGNSLRALGQIDEAVRCLRQAIRLKPDYAEAYNNLGIALVQQQQDEEALLSYEKALYFRPEYPEAHLNRSLAWLACGDFERGWIEYEWRWKAKDINCRTFRQRRWDGSDLHGRTVFVYLEQGVGDTLQFTRYARLLKQRGARVIVEVQKSLLKLLASCRYIDEVVPVGGPLPEFDLQVPLLSLPGIVGTTLDTIPADVPYLFADPQLVTRWRERLAPIEGFRVGIAWQGNPQYRGDRQRSVPLENFAPLAAIPGVQLVSLQKGFGTEQLGELGGRFPVVDLGPIDEEAGAFMDTAAIMRNLDVVVTSDTAMPHLAGALGVPVWMALPRVADWRWMREGDGCPWYPTMRVFRQREADNWDELFARIADALRQQVARRRASPSKETVAALDREAELEHQAALALAKEGRLEEAQYRLQKAIERNPQLVSAHHNLGVILARQKRLEPAIRAFLKTLELDPQYVDAYGNLGLAYLEHGRIDDAVAHLRKALRLAPGSTEIFNNLGVALMQQGKPADAAKSYRQALQIKPEYVEAHLNLGRALLTQGDLEQGWLEYEWRERLAGDQNHRSRKPRWNGAPLAGRTILLQTEQGLGDTLQFVRYANVVKQGGGNVFVECQSALTRILARCPGVDKVVGPGSAPPNHDVRAGLLSLPALLRTTISSIPSEVPYVFADPQLVEVWKPRLAKIEGFKVGIAWQGNPGWVDDRYRSIPLKNFQVLAEMPEVQLVSLQKGSGAEQIVTASNHFQIIDFGPQVDVTAGPFMDTAAIMQGLDLVITSDTSIAHLAGALGVPVWVALCYAPDWRWMTGRDDSPWYPSMRLFRQPRPGDWQTVFSNIAQALRKRLSTAKSLLKSMPLPLQRLPSSESNEAADPRPKSRSPMPAGPRAVSLANLNLTCPINRLGYGVVGANILKALVREGVSIACWPIGRVDTQPDDRLVIDEAIQRQATFDASAPSLRIAHQDQLAQHVGSPRVAFPIFELNRFTEKELNQLRSQDMLFVASRWAKGVVESNNAFHNTEHVQVVPLGVDRTIFCEPAEQISVNGQPRATVFMSVGKWERRKGHDVLLDAFNKAFSTEDHVELWMLAYNPVISADPNQAGAQNQEWESLYRSSRLGSKIKFLPRMVTHREVAAMMQQADCGVFLSRAEGWNLPALEMMSCGKQVIITNYSAHTEYCTSANAHLVEISHLEDAHDGRWFFGHGQWATLGHDQIERVVSCMREIHVHKQDGGSLLNQAGIDTAQRFSWEETAKRIVNVLGVS
jgi:tetratricopeptide (TPR) repeat protein/glycosyltransferase involved in cell wall biosynthesis